MPHPRAPRSNSVLFAALVFCVGFLGCGTSQPPTAPDSAITTPAAIPVSLSPRQAVISAGNSLQFTAIASSPKAGPFDWLVDGVIGGNRLFGTISPSGLYTAPPSFAPHTSVTITVASATKLLHVNVATVTLVQSPVLAPLSISPLTASLNPGQSQQFTALLGGTPDSAVEWFVNGVAGGNITVGTISSSGLYVAPQVVSASTLVTISAVSTHDTSNFSTAGISLNAISAPPNSSFTAVAHPIGINTSEAEYSWGSFPAAADLAFLKAHTITLIRLPIAWERAQPVLGGPLDPGYTSALKAFIAAAGAQGMQVIVDVHDYGRYNSHWAQDVLTNGVATPGGGTDPDDIIGSTTVPISAFADFWRQLAGILKGTTGLAYYDLMNEPHDMGGSDVWPSAAQAAVDAIRGVDAKTTILVEGTQWASARWWPWDNGNLHVNDSASNLLYEAHLYFDSDGSGRYAQSYSDSGAYPNVGVDRLQPFISWLQQNNAKGFVGEFGIPNTDPLWLPVLDNFLTAMQAAGISGTYWNYTFHSPNDPSWWPVNDPMSIINNGQANPQMDILVTHNTPVP